jgi:hypothetical protein
VPILINALVRTFDCPRGLLRLAFEHGLHPAGNRERRTVLDRDSEQQILDWIRQNAESSTSPTRKEIKNYWTSQFQIVITWGWVNLFVLPYLDQNMKTKSIPHKEQHLQVLVQDLKEYVQECTTEPVLNLDRVGISD